MELARHQHGAVTVLRPIGAISGEDAEGFRVQVQRVARLAMGRIALDLSETSFIDSRGLEAIVDLGDELGSIGQALRLCNVPDTLREVLALTGVADRVEQYEDAGSAARSFL